MIKTNCSVSGKVKQQRMVFEPKKPDYSGDGIAIWSSTDKNGKMFLKVKVLGGNVINCFKVEEKKKVEEEQV